MNKVNFQEMNVLPPKLLRSQSVCLHICVLINVGFSLSGRDGDGDNDKNVSSGVRSGVCRCVTC